MDAGDVAGAAATVLADLLCISAAAAVSADVWAGLSVAIAAHLCQAGLALCCGKRRPLARRPHALAEFPGTSGIFAGTATLSSVVHHLALAAALAAVLVLSSTANRGTVASLPSRWPADGLVGAQADDNLGAFSFAHLVVAAVPGDVLRIASDYFVKFTPAPLTRPVFVAATLLTGLRAFFFCCSDLAVFAYFVAKVQAKVQVPSPWSVRDADEGAGTGGATACEGRTWWGPVDGLGGGPVLASSGTDDALLAFHAACGVLIVVKLFWFFRGLAFVRAVCSGFS